MAAQTLVSARQALFDLRNVCARTCMFIAENAKFAGPSDRRGYFLSGSGKHPSITGPCDRLIVHCSPFLPHACAKLHLQWVCQKASGSAKNLVSAGPVVWHIKKSFRILCYSPESVWCRCNSYCHCAAGTKLQPRTFHRGKFLLQLRASEV